MKAFVFLKNWGSNLQLMTNSFRLPLTVVEKGTSYDRTMIYYD